MSDELEIVTIEPIELSEDDLIILQTGLTPIEWLDVDELKELYPEHITKE